jgi:hypothetical protein
LYFLSFDYGFWLPHWYIKLFLDILKKMLHMNITELLLTSIMQVFPIET